jgi:hypothetical protein
MFLAWALSLFAGGILQEEAEAAQKNERRQ